MRILFTKTKYIFTPDAIFKEKKIIKLEKMSKKDKLKIIIDDEHEDLKTFSDNITCSNPTLQPIFLSLSQKKDFEFLYNMTVFKTNLHNLYINDLINECISLNIPIFNFDSTMEKIRFIYENHTDILLKYVCLSIHWMNYWNKKLNSMKNISFYMIFSGEKIYQKAFIECAKIQPPKMLILSNIKDKDTIFIENKYDYFPNNSDLQFENFREKIFKLKGENTTNITTDINRKLKKNIEDILLIIQPLNDPYFICSNIDAKKIYNEIIVTLIANFKYINVIYDDSNFYYRNETAHWFDIKSLKDHSKIKTLPLNKNKIFKQVITINSLNILDYVEFGYNKPITIEKSILEKEKFISTIYNPDLNKKLNLLLKQDRKITQKNIEELTSFKDLIKKHSELNLFEI